MAKKEVKLGLKPMMNLMESDQIGKIADMAEERKFDIEAIKYFLNSEHVHCFIFETIIKSYAFEELYENFEDYICSNAAYRLNEEGEACAAFGWLKDMPSSSEELIALADKHPEKENIIFKNFFYKQRTTSLNFELRDKYTACLEGVCELQKRSYEGSFYDENFVNSQIFIWAQYISKDFINTMEEKHGVVSVVGWLQERIAHRMNYTKLEGLSDLFDTYEYLASHNRCPEGILNAISPYTWEGVAPGREKDYFEVSQKLYDRFVAPIIAKDPLSIYVKFGYNSHDEYNHLIAMLYTEDEELINYLFKASGKKYGLLDAISSIVLIQNNHRDLNFTITKEICDISKLVAKSPRSAIISEDITTADELLRLNAELNPFVNAIEPYHSNPYMTKHVRLDKFSDEDIDKLAFNIRWNQISRYFKDEKVPYDFLMKHRDKIKAFDSINYQALGDLTTSQKVSIFKTFGSIMGDCTKQHLVSKIIASSEDLSTSEAADLIREVDHLSTYGQEKCVKKLDIQSILTLL